MIDGARLKQAREALGLTQGALSEETGVPQPTISLIESGNHLVSKEETVRLANKLDVPVRFLFRSPIELPEGSLGLFRSLKTKVKTAETRASRRFAEIGVEAILRLAVGAPVPSVRIKPIPGADPESAAQHTRSMLRLSPEEPIGNLTMAMERSGVFVLRLSSISEHISGFSAWLDQIEGLSNGARPLVVARRPMSAFRLRFTLAHELGHLILGHEVFSGPLKPVERDANLFAQALLMPIDAALEDLGTLPLNIDRLLELKRKWGMSMHSLAMRAKQLQIIEESGYRNIYESLRARGYLKQEPGDLKTVAEQPRLLSELAKRRGLGDSAFDLANELDFGLLHMRAIVGEDPASGLDVLRDRSHT